jgi:hypothetical protein
VVLVKKKTLLFKTRLPEAKRITCVGMFAKLREPSLPSFGPTATFCGRKEQMEPEVTSGKLVSGDKTSADATTGNSVSWMSGETSLQEKGNDGALSEL